MKYKCHCIIHLYDGVATMVRKELKEVEAESEEKARERVSKAIKNRYRGTPNLSLSSINISIDKEVTPCKNVTPATTE